MCKCWEPVKIYFKPWREHSSMFPLAMRLCLGIMHSFELYISLLHVQNISAECMHYAEMRDTVAWNTDSRLQQVIDNIKSSCRSYIMIFYCCISTEYTDCGSADFSNTWSMLIDSTENILGDKLPWLSCVMAWSTFTILSVTASARFHATGFTFYY